MNLGPKKMKILDLISQLPDLTENNFRMELNIVSQKNALKTRDSTRQDSYNLVYFGPLTKSCF